MDPLAILARIDLGKLGSMLDLKKYDKDAKRLGMFFVALPKRAAQMSHDEALRNRVPDMLQEAAILGAEYAKASNPKKWNPFKDPYAQAREDVRAFAKKWALDPAFIAAMG